MAHLRTWRRKAPWYRSSAVVPLLAVVILVAPLGIAVGRGQDGGPGARRRSTDRDPSARTLGAGARLARSPVGSDGQPLAPKLFAAGACVAFTPTAGNRHRTIFVDAGHGGLDPGAVGTTQSGQTIYEADETLPVELDVMSLLRAQGFRVVVSRTGQSTVARPLPGDLTGQAFTDDGARDDIAARDKCADLAQANLLVGIYFDAGTSPTDAGCISAYDATRPFSAQNLRFATLLQNDVLAQLNARGWGIPNDGVVSDVSLGGPPLTTAAAAYDHLLLLGPADPGYFTSPSTMPGALIEPLFITDPTEATIANSSAGHAAIASGMAQAIEQYFGSPSSPRNAAGNRQKRSS